jgi:di/tricarboxylate transporter
MYNAAVLAVHRGGTRLTGKVGDVVLRPGDTILMQTGAHFARANRNNPDFLLVSGVAGYRPVRHEKAVISIVLLLLLVCLMASGLVPIVLAAFLVAGLMVLTRCISVADARQSVDWQTLVTIAGAFAIGKALVNSGFVGFAAGHVSELIAPYGPVAVLAAVYFLTTCFTEVVTNNAAAALVYPFAIAIAQELGVDARPFAMAIALAASASFMTPLGYQTNLMVYGPGGYTLRDYLRVGAPLNLLLLVCAVLLVPWAWPFH